jgi:3-dehydroquinate dehydratase type I
MRICVSILPRTITEALRLIERAEEARADLIEVRLDRLGNHSKLAEVANHGKTPKIATNKPPSCPGNFSGTETERLQTLLSAAKAGFEYVDIELTHPKLKETVRELESLGVKPIVSFHDFAEPLSLPELNSVLEREIASGADVCKIVTTAKQMEDNLAVLSFTSTACAKAKVVCFAMGELGRVSRLLSPLFGGYFTFASLERGGETAAGQMTIQEMKTAYRMLGLK